MTAARKLAKSPDRDGGIIAVVRRARHHIGGLLEYIR